MESPRYRINFHKDLYWQIFEREKLIATPKEVVISCPSKLIIEPRNPKNIHGKLFGYVLVERPFRQDGDTVYFED